MPLTLNEACLTPAFRGRAAVGRVHSVFDRAANIAIPLERGEIRLLTLLLPGTQKMPDSIGVSGLFLRGLTAGAPLALEAWETGGRLGGAGFFLSPWTGAARPLPRRGDPAVFRAALAGLGRESGLERLPPKARERAYAALARGDLNACIGLGPGLTPAFDDAAVGFLCALKTQGAPCPQIPGAALEDTTDISARYLRLAGEGYFSEALLRVARAAAEGEGLLPALQIAAEYGATSGVDGLEGFGLGLRFLAGETAGGVL